MCGIVGIISKKPFSLKSGLLASLKKLEYRGYDSVGFATPNYFKKDVGEISDFVRNIEEKKDNIGISHCRWATHGGISEKNAHPHQSCDKKIIIVHNGIIENFEELKQELIKKGHKFISETDSEIIAHYFEEKLKKKDIKNAIMDFLNDIKGTFAILIIKNNDDKIYAIKRDSPLTLGLCKESFILASDIHAFSDKTDRAIFFEDDEFAIVSKEKFKFFNKNGKEIKKEVKTFEWKEEKGLDNKFEHFMIKEINEQPLVSRRLLNSLNTTQKENVNKIVNLMKNSKRIVFLAVGTSYHAALVGDCLFNKLGLEFFTTNAPDFNPNLVKDETLVIAITQSGETMDVIKAIKQIGKKVKIVSLVNVPYSTIQRLSDLSLEISAGQEICVASTKAFTNQVLAVMYLAKHFGYENDLSKIPEKIKETISDNEKKIKEIANKLYNKSDIYVIGKGALFPVAKEIALKIKEISYIHAEGMQAGELKHGTIALIDKEVPVISLIPDNDSSLVSNTKEVEARGAFTIAITNTKTDLKPNAEFIVPEGDEMEFALYSNIIGQLLTYYIALKLGRPIDKPRHLAKAVSVI